MVFIIIGGFAALCAGGAILVLLAGWESEEGNLQESLREGVHAPMTTVGAEDAVEEPEAVASVEEELELERERDLVAVP